MFPIPTEKRRKSIYLRKVRKLDFQCQCVLCLPHVVCVSHFIIVYDSLALSSPCASIMEFCNHVHKNYHTVQVFNDL